MLDSLRLLADAMDSSEGWPPSEHVRAATGLGVRIVTPSGMANAGWMVKIHSSSHESYREPHPPQASEYAPWRSEVYRLSMLRMCERLKKC